MLKVLLVDDDPNLLAGLRRALLGQPPQWEVRLAKDAQEGLDLIAADTVDLVISDMRMPGMDGAAFLERVKEEYPHTVRVVLSGYSEMSSSVRSVAVAHQFLSKPCSPFTLLRVIEQARGFYEQVDEDLRRSVADLVSLPSPPNVVSSFGEALRSNASVDTVAAIAASDIALTAKMLQLANSAFFDEARETTSVRDAVRWVGVDALREVSESTELFRPLITDGTGGVALADLEAHAVATSATARSIAGDDAATASAAGMLHDVGLLVLATVAPEMLAASISGASQLHRTLGDWLLAIWGIPGSVIQAVHDFIDPPDPLEREMNAAHALRIAGAMESKRHPGWTAPVDLPPGYVESFGIDRSRF